MTDGVPVRAVLFDRDQTLTFTDRRVYARAARWLAARHALNASAAGATLAAHWEEHHGAWQGLRTLDDEAAFWTAYSEGLMCRLGVDPQHAAEFLAHYGYERYLVAVPGAREVLTSLRGHGLKIGVLSNTLPSVQLTLDAVGLGDLVDVALASAALGVHKPQVQAFHLAAQALGVPEREILFVDDLPENVAGARAAGMQAALIDLGGGHPEAIHDLRDVLSLAGVA